MTRVDQNIFLAQDEILTHFELSQDPVGEFNCASHVADPPTKTPTEDEDGEQNEDHHNRGRVNGPVGEGGHPHHRGLAPNLDVEDMP